MPPRSWTIGRMSTVLAVLFVAPASLWTLAANQTNTEQNPFYRIDRVACEYPNPHICPRSGSICKLQLVNRTTQFAHVGCQLASTVDNIHVRVVLYYKYTTYQPMAIDITEDFCSAMRAYVAGDQHAAGRTPLLSTLLKNIIPNSNINHACPYNGNVTASRLRIGEVMFKDFIPSGKYLLFLRIFEKPKNDTIINVRVYFTLPASKIMFG